MYLPIKSSNFISCFLIFSISVFQNLFSLPIDLSDETLNVSIPNQIDSLELYNFKKNTTYVLHITGDKQLTPHEQPGFIITENNSILIENQEQLSANDAVSIPLNPTENSKNSSDILISKLSFRTDQYPNLGNDKWGEFIDKVKDWTIPGEVTMQLIEITKDSPLRNVFNVGCESGKDPLYWVQQGADVTILDGTPHAVAISSLRLADRGALINLKGVFASLLEEIPDDAGIFDAVTGTAAFPFIPPHLFEEVMVNKLFSHVAPSGYFAGHFFGPEHAWADDETMTFISQEELIDLFIRNGFEIIWLDESKKSQPTVLEGTIMWHEIKIIARKM